jgi:hypothetical protein
LSIGDEGSTTVTVSGGPGVSAAAAAEVVVVVAKLFFCYAQKGTADEKQCEQ